MKTNSIIQNKVAGNCCWKTAQLKTHYLTCRNSPAKKFNLTILFIFCIVTFGSVNFSSAQITAGFELDGNATAVAPNPPDDWDLIFNNTDNASVTTGILIDAPSNNDNAFTQGSSDVNDVTTWGWQTFTVPDKDDILHGGAALYNGDQLFFFGDRFATNGSAEIGLWFFKDKVGPLPDGSFSGQHQVGDILLLTNFVNGGGVAEVGAYEWVGSGGAFGGGTLDSLPVNGTNLFAITNSSAVPSPWPFVPKTGPNNIFGDGAFFEGGIDLGGLNITVNACFTSFMIQTRASHSLTAELKDFLTGNFFTTPQVSVNSESICLGDSATLTATVTGGQQPISYLWSTGATTSSITVSPSNTTTYTVTVTASNACTSVPVEAIVTVNPEPTCAIGSTTPSNLICNSGNYTIGTSVTGASYSWSISADGNPPGWAIVGSSTSQNITFSSGNCGGPAFLVHISLTVTDLATGCVSTCSVSISPGVPACNVDIRPPVTMNCNVTSQYLLAVYSTDIFTPSFMWTLNGSPIGAGINDGSGLDSIQITLGGTYRFTITDLSNSANTCFAEVVVSQDTTPPVCNISCGSLSICPGGSNTLTASGGTSFLWSTGATTATITVSPSVTTSYTVTVTGDNGCTSSCSATVVVNPNPTCSIAPVNPSICTGDATTLTASGGNSFLWSTGETTASITVNPTSTTTYTVTVTSPFGCTSSCATNVIVNPLPTCNITCPNPTICVGGSATLNASGGVSFLWSTGATTASITVSPSVTTSYTVTVTDANGCSSSCSITVTVNPLPICSITCGSMAICIGGSTTLTAGGGTSFLWSTGATTASITVSPTVTTTYTVTVTDGNGCSSSCSATVTVNPLPPCSIGNVNPATLICNTGNYTISTSLSPLQFSFVWTMSVDGNPPGWAIVGSNTGQTLTFSSGNCGSPGFLVHFTLTVTDIATGCVSTCSTSVAPGAPACNVDIRPPVVLNCIVTSQYLLATYSTDILNPVFVWTRNNVSIGAGINDGNGLDSILITQPGTYRFTIHDQVNSSNDCFAEVEVIQDVTPPQCAITCGSLSICPGGSVTLTASGGDSFLWSTGATTASITVSPSVTTTYTVTVTNASNGCTSSCSATIVVNPVPVCNIAPSNPSICVGGSTTLTASGGTSFLWSTGATTAAITVNPSVTTTYTVTVTNAQGCTSSCSTTVTVNPLPICNITCPNPVICVGGSATLTASGGVSFLWSTGATTASITVSPAVTTTYTVTVTSAAGCTSSCSTTVTVNPLPVCNITPANPAICIGASSTLTASGGTSFSWSTGATTASITVSPTVTTTYTVTVTNANGCTSSCSTTVTVNPLPPCSIGNVNPSNLICNTGNYTISTSLSPLQFSFVWTMSVDGNPPGWGIVGSNTGQTITFSSGNCGSPGFQVHFTLTVTDINTGCVSTCSASFAPGAPACNVDIRPPVVLNCIVTSQYLLATYSTDILNPIFEWTRNNVSIGAGINDGNGSDSIQITLPGTYRFSIHDQVNSANDCFAEVIVIQDVTPPQCAITCGSLSICPGGSVTLTASGGSSFLWSTGATTASITVSPSVTTTYTVTVTNASNGCTSSCSATIIVNPVPVCSIAPSNPSICVGGSTTLTASGGTSFLWSTGATTAAISVNPSVTTTYTVTVTNAQGCTSSCSTTVTVNPLPICNITCPNPVICIGGSATLTASGGVSFLWSTGATTASITVSPAVTTTYTVTVTSAAGCTSSCSTTVTVNPLPVCNIAPANPSICVGSSSTLTASGGTSFSWSTGATTASITVSPTVTTTYTVTVTNGNGCSSSCSTTVTVNPLPICSITCGSLSICVGGSNTLTASGGTSFLWSTGATTASITVSPIVTTTYTVTVTNGNGCTSSCSTTLIVNPLPPCSIGSVVPGNVLCNTGNYTISTSLNPALFSFSWAITVDGNPGGWNIVGSNTGQTLTFSSGNCGPTGFQVHFTLTVTDLATGCVSTCSTSVGPGAPVCNADVRPPVLLTCLVTSQYLLASYGTDFLNPIFMWTRNNVPIGAGINNTALGLDSILITLPGTYRFTIANPLNASDTCFGEVIVNQNVNTPSCNINLPASAPFCNSVGNTLGATISSPDPVTFVWTSSNPSWIITSANNVNPITYTAGTGSTTWTLTITNTVSGCVGTCTATSTCQSPFLGCTLGFWKNHPSLWNDASDPISACIAAAISAQGSPYSGNGTTSALFSATFGLTSAQMTAAGYSTSLTLLQALNLGGGGFNMMARQGVASLLNTCAFPPNFPYSTAQVLTMMHNAVINNTPGTTGNLFASANEQQPEGCPPGGPATPNSIGKKNNHRDAEDADGSFATLKAYPNPFSSHSTIEFTVPASHATVEIFDANGNKVAELFNGNTIPDELYSVDFNGDLYAPGIYFYKLTYDGDVYYDKLTLIK